MQVRAGCAQQWSGCKVIAKSKSALHQQLSDGCRPLQQRQELPYGQIGQHHSLRTDRKVLGKLISAVGYALDGALLLAVRGDLKKRKESLPEPGKSRVSRFGLSLVVQPLVSKIVGSNITCDDALEAFAGTVQILMGSSCDFSLKRPKCFQSGASPR